MWNSNRPVFKNRLAHNFDPKPAGSVVFNRFASLSGLTTESDHFKSWFTVQPVEPAGPIRFW